MKNHNTINLIHSKNGFTLFEVLITVSIIIILTGYGLPAYQNLKMNKTMTSSINQLIGGFSFARNQSIIRTKQLIVCPSSDLSGCSKDSNWHNGWMVFVDENMNRKLDDEDEILTTINQTDQKFTATSSTYRKLVRYDSYGSSPGTNVTINFCDSRGKEHAKSIVINNIGRARVSQTGTCG